ncbi:putative DNA (cytosine-5-)-methyltransferase [Rosa chinensis]|uniref:Putative DNA (Cytosine-5-)-methyltransferase n=1 Tax=Rosa chinensis TaxID=74649 RepID=A0A2P6S988_ROSCH|nr:putative DNA (cytosine-5-)-methyltransferase [Rosa chinensis]
MLILLFFPTKRKRIMGHGNQIIGEDADAIHLPNPMIGFRTPADLCQIHRSLPDAVTGPPYCYYENVALTPKGVWGTISRFLYDKKGNVHNLPIKNRFPLIPLPPQTIVDAFPMTRRWWPTWDDRTKLNCLQTCTAGATITDRIMMALKDYDEDEMPPESVHRCVLYECCKWNLVWIDSGLSPVSFERSISQWHQCPLSLFSGFGGAEIALYRLGIPMKNVVSVEISEVSRNVVRCWWEQTNQGGNMYHLADVQELNVDFLEPYISSFGGFDLVSGGSPCNNLAGSNRHHRDGLKDVSSETGTYGDFLTVGPSVENS